MVVAMRLMRVGQTHLPVYRISIADSRRAPSGKFIEHIGTYNPHPDKMGNKQDESRIDGIDQRLIEMKKAKIAMGCQPSTVMSRLLSRFHLLPVPPMRSSMITGVLLHKVLAGEDVRHLVARAGDSAAMTLTTPVMHEPRVEKYFGFSPPTAARIEQLKNSTSKWKLNVLPFDCAPTSATMQAWAQARIYHKNAPPASVGDAAQAQAHVDFASNTLASEVATAAAQQHAEEQRAAKQVRTNARKAERLAAEKVVRDEQNHYQRMHFAKQRAYADDVKIDAHKDRLKLLRKHTAIRPIVNGAKLSLIEMREYKVYARELTAAHAQSGAESEQAVQHIQTGMKGGFDHLLDFGASIMRGGAAAGGELATTDLADEEAQRAEADADAARALAQQIDDDDHDDEDENDEDDNHDEEDEDDVVAREDVLEEEEDLVEESAEEEEYDEDLLEGELEEKYEAEQAIVEDKDDQELSEEEENENDHDDDRSAEEDRESAIDDVDDIDDDDFDRR